MSVEFYDGPWRWKSGILVSCHLFLYIFTNQSVRADVLLNYISSSSCRMLDWQKTIPILHCTASRSPTAKTITIFSRHQQRFICRTFRELLFAMIDNFNIILLHSYESSLYCIVWDFFTIFYLWLVFAVTCLVQKILYRHFYCKNTRFTDGKLLFWNLLLSVTFSCLCITNVGLN